MNTIDYHYLDNNVDELFDYLLDFENFMEEIPITELKKMSLDDFYNLENDYYPKWVSERRDLVLSAAN